MHLRERFKRLTLWNKVGTIGAIASVASLVIGAVSGAVGMWFWFATGPPVPVIIYPSPPGKLRPAGYQYRYFRSEDVPTDDELRTEEARGFVRGLARARNRALAQLQAAYGPGAADHPRLRLINDYVFRIYRSMYFIQAKSVERKGANIHLRPTMLEPPDYGSDAPVAWDFEHDDPVDNWSSVGYADEFAPVLLRCDEYYAPDGPGYTVVARVIVEGRLWQNRMHFGPETYRVPENFVWEVVEPEPVALVHQPQQSL